MSHEKSDRATQKAKPKLTPAHQRIIDEFLEGRIEPFRRADLSEHLRKAVRPRITSVSDAHADVAIRELAARGRIQRHGHLHWKLVRNERRLLNGGTAPELDELVELPIKTRCPTKWLSIDLETGEFWIGTASGWKRASNPEKAKLLKAVSSKEK